MDLDWKNPARNLETLEEVLKTAISALSGVSPGECLFVFPELTLTAFVTRDPSQLAVARDAPSLKRVAELARTYKTAIVAGWIEKNPARPEKPFNALSVWGPDGTMLTSYRKQHLFTKGNPSEAETFEAGSENTILSYRGFKIGLSICFDLRFPKLYQKYALSGVDAIICAACWVGGPHKSLQIQALSRAQAILTRSYFVSVNRTGRDPFFEYEGEALAYSPVGEELKTLMPVELSHATIDAARTLPLTHEV